MPRFTTNLAILATVAITTTIATPSLALRPADVPIAAYQRLTHLPLENQYINLETKKPDEKNTLISRLVRYHVYLKGRPSNYRLDWKLTLADYLDANDIMDPATYPSHERVTVNPMDRDRTIIQSLKRSERDQLIQTLVDLFNQPR